MSVKKITKVFFVLFLLYAIGCALFANNAYAAPCYGTRMPDKFKFTCGFESYSLFKRYLRDTYGKVRSQQQFFNLSFGVLDWVSLDLKAGGGNIKQHPVGSDEIDYTSSFAGGYGLRLKFFDKDKIKGVFGFQHISVHPKSTHLGDIKNKAILDDWQFSLLGSYDFKIITPYIGMRWSRIDYIHKAADESRKHIRSDATKCIGLIFGFDVPVTKAIWINLEGQFLDSDALAASINYKF
jgi:hypothetical protein